MYLQHAAPGGKEGAPHFGSLAHFPPVKRTSKFAIRDFRDGLTLGLYVARGLAGEVRSYECVCGSLCKSV